MTTVAVTGAFGYSGRVIAERFLNEGWSVRTLTNADPRLDPFRGVVAVNPLAFQRPDLLVRALGGVDVLVNTYWVRFSRGGWSHASAVANTLELIRAARCAGVERLVHISITNPSHDSHLEYFKGKALLESAVVASGISYGILRPAVLFGRNDILVNNIAWMLRRFPVFGIFGDGAYGLQPIHVDDLAALVVGEASLTRNAITDAIGPETFTYRELVKTVGCAIGCNRPLVSVPPSVGYALARTMGAILGDVVLTREEIAGLMDGLLRTDSPPSGTTRLSEWAHLNKASLGVRYANELKRRR